MKKVNVTPLSGRLLIETCKRSILIVVYRANMIRVILKSNVARRKKVTPGDDSRLTPKIAWWIRKIPAVVPPM
jgi:hypothetical protein